MTAQVAFGYHRDWSRSVICNLDPARYQVTVAPLDALDLMRFDAVIPLHLEHYNQLARNKSKARNYIVPATDLVELCDDKYAFAVRLCDLGFSRFVPAIYREPPLGPFIRKPRRGEWGRACTVELALGNTRSVLNDDNFMMQEVIHGPEEYALHILRTANGVKYARIVEYTMSGDQEIRSPSCKPKQQRFVEDPSVVSLMAHILSELQYTGTCCINYKFKDGIPKILEINPRFGASLTHDLQNYVDAYLHAVRQISPSNRNRSTARNG